MPRRLEFSDLANLAGVLTLARLPLAFVTAFVMHDRVLFVAVFLLAMLTDLLDGPVARWRRCCSRAGAIADGWADKIFLINYAWSMQMLGLIEPHHMMLWFLREMIQGAFVPLVALDYALARKPHPAPRIEGRVCTISVALAMGAGLLGWSSVMEILTVVAAVSGGGVGLLYLHRDRPWERLPWRTRLS